MNLDEMERRAHKTLNGSRQYIKANATDVLTLIAALREGRETLRGLLEAPTFQKCDKADEWLARFKDDS